METIGKYFRECDSQENIGVCAHLIKQQLTRLKKSEIKNLKQKKLTNNLRNHKKILKLLIRIASESHDHGKTVDFVSKQARDRLYDNNIKREKRYTGISHEHIVPCEVIYQEILNQPDRVLEILQALSYRALVLSKGERDKLDVEHKSKMPAGWTFGDDVLARYRDQNLVDELIPMTKRGRQLL